MARISSWPPGLSVELVGTCMIVHAFVVLRIETNKVKDHGVSCSLFLVACTLSVYHIILPSSMIQDTSDVSSLWIS